MRGHIALLALLLAPVWPAADGRAQQLYVGSSSVLPEQVERMYVRGMDFLARTQTPAGNWPDESHGTEQAINGLAVVSLLAHGTIQILAPTAR